MRRALFSLLTVFLAMQSTASADDAKGTDPTEPSSLAPVITIPHEDEVAARGSLREQNKDREASADEAEGEPEAGAAPGDPWGSAIGDGLLSLRALFQLRYMTTLARESTNPRESYAVRENWLAQADDGFAFNRLFLRVGSDPTPYLGFKAVLDLSELIDNDPEDVLKQAYVSFRPIPGHLEIVASMFKLPFSTLELDASSRFEFAHFGEANRLTSRLGFAGRDIGVQVIGAPFAKAKRMRITVGAFRGQAYGEYDLPVGSVAGRIELKPNKILRLGLDGVLQPRSVTYDRPFNTSNSEVVPNPSDPRYPTQKRRDKGYAVSADFRIKKKGFMLRGEGMYGTRVDVDERYGAQTFWAAWALAAYRIDAGRTQLLPAVRYEWLDADIEQDRGVFAQLSASFSILFMARARLMFDVTLVDAQQSSPLLNQRKPLQAEPFFALDTLRATLQLQVEL